jgi:hypothetical protein
VRRAAVLRLKYRKHLGACSYSSRADRLSSEQS